MPAQIAICQGTQLLKIVEDQTFGISDQRGKYAKASALVDHSIQAFIGEATFAR
jgi:hypothetical protein